MIERKKSKITNSTIFLIVFIFAQQLFPQADFTIIGLPDTQYYTENDQGSGTGQGTGNIATFIAQTDWIVANRADSNIVYAAHLGDCVQDGDSVESQWTRAVDAMDNLEVPVLPLLPDGIPYGIAVGNHDMSPWDNDLGNSTTNFYNQYFGVSRFSGRDYYAGHHGTTNDNHYDTISVGSIKLIFVYIKYAEYRENPQVIVWADSLLSAFDDRYGIVVSHKLLDNVAGSNVSFSTAGDSIYKHCRENANFFLMLAGHWTKEASRTETRGGDSTDVVTLMSDYQGLANGGNGWLRIMRFSPTDNKIYVNTYSPTLDQFKTGSDSRFTINYDFPPLPLPVELAYFAGAINGNEIDLRWRTETEINNYGFDIERSSTSLGTSWETIGFIEGHGNSNSPKQYNFIDSDIYQARTYYYRLKQIDNDGTTEYSNIIAVEVGIPNSFILSQNYPNPFNPETRIDFKISDKQLVTLRVYNTLGEQVAELVNELREAGSYSVTFDGSNMPSGVYIYRLQTSSYTANKKMTLLK